MKAFQINCDLGEGMDDARLMPYLDACSIACGGHAGDEETMRATVRLAKKHGVKVGAHPSFPDREGFGRKVVEMDTNELSDALTRQVAELKRICDQENMTLTHLKPHGALYNLASIDTTTAEVVVGVARAFGLPLLAPWQSEMAQIAADQTIPVVLEGFADRLYHGDRSLVSRSVTGAVIADPELAARQVASVVNDGLLPALEGTNAPMQAVTFCIHSDNPAAIPILQRINQLRNEN